MNFTIEELAFAEQVRQLAHTMRNEAWQRVCGPWLREREPFKEPHISPDTPFEVRLERQREARDAFDEAEAVGQRELMDAWEKAHGMREFIPQALRVIESCAQVIADIRSAPPEASTQIRPDAPST